ncbi:MAG: branched-chain amino acid ABC transporter permease [Gammaproteobacteria bacterium]|nr:branched-chain amino acid ABC transporter permease [Gammaproteobacteria bacterium]
MDIFVQQLFNGIILGSIYALIALGYTMVYGILGLINFAHGEVVMIGAMVTITLLRILVEMNTGLPAAALVALAITTALPLCALLGFTLERVAYRPLRNAPRLSPLITAIGLSIILQNLAMIIWGRNYAPFPPILDTTPWKILGAAITPLQVVIVILAVAIMAGLWLLIGRTRKGRAMRAVAQNPNAARLMGVNVDGIISLTFVLGSSLGCIAGVMVAANYGQAHATMGFMLGLKAFAAAVLGGIGNLAGAMIGGLLLGLIESFGAGYIGDLTGGFLGSQYQDVFAFLVLILVLVFRPSGLMGERVAERA